MISNTSNILGIELLAAAQGIEFLRPLRSSEALEAVYALLRKDIPAHTVDRYLAPDMAHATQMVRDGSVAQVLRSRHQRLVVLQLHGLAAFTELQLAGGVLFTF
jgi:histidine ammonia-lyase